MLAVASRSGIESVQNYAQIRREQTGLNLKRSNSGIEESHIFNPDAAISRPAFEQCMLDQNKGT
jgi:hypothetical protein